MSRFVTTVSDEESEYNLTAFDLLVAAWKVERSWLGQSWAHAGTRGGVIFTKLYGLVGRRIVNGKLMKILRAGTIEERHITRAYVYEIREAQERIEEYGILELAAVSSLIIPEPEGRDTDYGRAI